MSTFRIISFDGGGIKGALSTRILKRLYLDNPNLLKKTNLFAGTSTGALIALSLAYGFNGKEIDDIYCYKNIKNIFSPKRFNLLHPRYKDKSLKNFIESTISKEATLNDLQKYVFIPAFHLKGVNQEDKSGMKLKVINNTDKLVNVNISDDDSHNKRVVVEGDSSKVSVNQK